MAQFSIRNRETGITLEAHEFAAVDRYALYEAYVPGTHIVSGHATYQVRTTNWNRNSQEFVVAVTYVAHVPQAEDLYC